MKNLREQMIFMLLSNNIRTHNNTNLVYLLKTAHQEATQVQSYIPDQPYIHIQPIVTSKAASCREYQTFLKTLKGNLSQAIRILSSLSRRKSVTLKSHRPAIKTVYRLVSFHKNYESDKNPLRDKCPELKSFFIKNKIIVVPFLPSI